MAAGGRLGFGTKGVSRLVARAFLDPELIEIGKLNPRRPKP